MSDYRPSAKSVSSSSTQPGPRECASSRKYCAHGQTPGGSQPPRDSLPGSAMWLQTARCSAPQNSQRRRRLTVDDPRQRLETPPILSLGHLASALVRGVAGKKAVVGLMQGGSEFAQVGVRTGDILAGKYRIERVLGVGGMGVVVAAHHIQLDERVAIKFLLPEATLNHEIVARFAREARAAVKIKSEYVARVSDVGALDSGSPYMVMEYLDGSDLSAWVRQRGALPTEQAVEFILQACEAIADAHGLGIIHRDLKPANLFCIRRSDGLLAIKVLDFGISKVTNPNGASLEAQMTRTSAVFGSPLYMSPEQMLSSRDVDARTDIWAMGAILFELLTTRSPFEGETLPEVYARISTQPPPPLQAFRPDAPSGLEAVMLKCLAKDRSQRYLNVAELAVALAPFAPKRARASADRICRVIQAAGLSATSLALPPSSDTVRPNAEPGTSAAWGHTLALPPSSDTVRPNTEPGTSAAWGHTERESKRGPSKQTLVLVAGVLLVGSAGTLLIGVLNRDAGPPKNTVAAPSSILATLPPAEVLPTAQSEKPVVAPVESGSVAGPTTVVVPVVKPPAMMPSRNARIQSSAQASPVTAVLLPKPQASVPPPKPAVPKDNADWLRRQY